MHIIKEICVGLLCLDFVRWRELGARINLQKDIFINQDGFLSCLELLYCNLTLNRNMYYSIPYH